MDARSSSEQVQLYWTILVRRRWVVLLAVLTASLIALLGSFLSTPLYRATTRLQIERYNPDIFLFRDVSQVDYSWAAYADFYETQFQIIASRPVARKTVERLGLTEHPGFVAPALETDERWLDKIRSWVPRRETRRVPDPIDRVAGSVLAGLEVSPVRNSHLVDISWVSADPDLAAEVANAIAAAYVHVTIESQFSTSDQAEEFLVNQVVHLKNEIAVIEEELQSYGEAKRIISMEGANNITFQALNDIAARKTAVQTQLAHAEAAYRAVTEAEPDALPEVLNSALIASLREEYASHEAELAERTRGFGEDWPELQTLSSRLEGARDRLDIETRRIADQVRASAETAFVEAREELTNLDRLLLEQEEVAQRMKRDAVEFANLRSEVRKKRETLNSLMKRQTEMSLSTRLKDLDSTSTNIRVMQRAQSPIAPFKPNTRNNLALGLLVGCLVGISAAFLLEYLDNTIGAPDELTRLVDLPILAVVPRYGDETSTLDRVRGRRPVVAGSFDLVTEHDGRSAAAEAYRELRTSILLSNPGQPPRRVLITSAVPEEGKTATATNLAIVLAQLDRRVLVVDTDLRRPRLHRAFDLDNARGVSTYLSGLENDPATLIVSTGIERLDLLPSGPIPPNPSELLDSSVFHELTEQLLARGYDHVVFDAPPALSVTDPLIIASAVDSGILVVRAGRTPRQSVRQAADKLRQAELRHFGLVLNGLDPEGRGSAYHGHYVAYGEPQAADGPAEGHRRKAGA